METDERGGGKGGERGVGERGGKRGGGNTTFKISQTYEIRRIVWLTG